MSLLALAHFQRTRTSENNHIHVVVIDRSVVVLKHPSSPTCPSSSTSVSTSESSASSSLGVITLNIAKGIEEWKAKRERVEIEEGKREVWRCCDVAKRGNGGKCGCVMMRDLGRD
jgi:hypothetical protein